MYRHHTTPPRPLNVQYSYQSPHHLTLPEPQTPEQRESWEEGRQAALAGSSMKSCPYTLITDARMRWWGIGFLAGRKEFRRQPKP